MDLIRQNTHRQFVMERHNFRSCLVPDYSTDVCSLIEIYPFGIQFWIECTNEI